MTYQVNFTNFEVNFKNINELWSSISYYFEVNYES